MGSDTGNGRHCRPNMALNRTRTRRRSSVNHYCQLALVGLASALASLLLPLLLLVNDADALQLRPPTSACSSSLARRTTSLLATDNHDGSEDLISPATPPSVNSEIASLMAQHDPILLFASRLLPPTVAADASALYAWCRRLDEIVDNPATASDPQAIRCQIDELERRFEELWDGRPVDGMDEALAETIARRSPSLGRKPFMDMLKGMRDDVIVDNNAATGRRVETLADLEEYAYQVAGTVGLMLLPLLLDGDVQAIEKARGPAVSLGKAIQLVNILRDAAPDAALGHIYLPQNMLVEAGVEEADVLALRSSPAYCSVVKSVAGRATELLAEAESGRRTLPGPLGPLFVQIIVELYRGYLDRLDQMEYDNLCGGGGDRVRIDTARKMKATIQAMREVLLS